MNTARTTLPRRAGTIRAVAASLAARHEATVIARQIVSDRASYALAFLLGGLVFRVGGWYGLALGACFYGWRAYRSWRAWRGVK
jgi:hypothetical protein